MTLLGHRLLEKPFGDSASVASGSVVAVAFEVDLYLSQTCSMELF